jgi:uncharacterized oxidoreductase
MQFTGNKILITGGGSGIGRALAEALHALGNQVIIAGRRQAALDTVVAAHPGMTARTLDVENAEDIRAFAARILAEHPDLNVLINNAGIMRLENLQTDNVDLVDAEATIATNLLGPVRLTAALLPHLRKQRQAAVIMVSSGLAFLPLATTPTYSATKAAIHSYAQSLRFQLRHTSVRVLEIAPPYVQTELMGSHQAVDPDAMPLKEYIQETIALLQSSPVPDEVLVERVKPLRFAERNGTFSNVFDTLNEARAAATVR